MFDICCHIINLSTTLHSNALRLNEERKVKSEELWMILIKVYLIYNQFLILRSVELRSASINQKSNGAPQKCVSFLGKRSKQTNGKRFDERQTVK